MFVERLRGGVNLAGVANTIAAIYETTLESGQTIQPHYHPDAEEVYYLLSGNGLMHIGNEQKAVEMGDVVYIPPEKVHFLQNTSSEPLRFITLTVRVYKVEAMPYIL
ncbi:MAG: cupin domain-containing protein [Methanophagales archaeon ANME-1-THS]|nr:MAG: cupin domain-containing protein [Methanophagales archaeon ANME-1-THS]